MATYRWKLSLRPWYQQQSVIAVDAANRREALAAATYLLGNCAAQALAPGDELPWDDLEPAFPALN